MPNTTATWGLKTPTPLEAPDGPGGLVLLAGSVEDALGKRRAVLQNNGGASVQTAGIDIAPDTVITDPSGMVSGQGFKALWPGLYRIGARAAVNGGDIPTTASVLIDCIDGASGAVYGQSGQWGMPSDMPMTYVDELVFPINTTFRFRLRWTGGFSRGLSYGAVNTRARIFAQYLGPA